MKKFFPDLRSLPVQMILSFVALVLLTAAAAGLPAIWLIRNQLERQIWAQIEQGQRATQALYVAQQNELAHLATLTAQRPTLHDLIAQQAYSELPDYLRTLQAGTMLNLILICNQDNQVVAQVGNSPAGDFCALDSASGYHLLATQDSAHAQLWLLAAQNLAGQGQVVVGVLLDDSFARRIQSQTGLDHTLLVDNKIVASSLSHQDSTLSALLIGDTAETRRYVLTINSHPYYALRFRLPSVGQNNSVVEAEAALATTDIVATQQGLIWALLGSIVIVAAVGSVLATLLARRINRPLNHLTKAARALSQGNLDSPVVIKTQVREITLVAQALENARVDLQRTLTELRREKAWSDHLLEAIAEGIIILDHQHRITFFSPGAERITGWHSNQVLGHTCDEIFQIIDAGQKFSQLIRPGGRRYKVSVLLANNHEATLSITVARFTPPQTSDSRVVLVFRDVSEEETIHRLMGHFMANVSHEFRTPLSSIAASVELLLDQAPDLSQDELQELLVSLHLGILGLQKLVDNLLESASIEAGRFKVHVRPTDLGEIIVEAIRMMQPLLDKLGQSLELELPAKIPTVRADARRTGQALVNLLSNASRYGPDEAEISIGVTVNNGWVKVAVGDRGPGVAPAHRHSLFRRFVYPGSDSDKTQYGAGLGLSVVKAVVEAQGGQVGVQDRPGGGLTFWFTLPVEERQ